MTLEEFKHKIYFNRESKIRQEFYSWLYNKDQKLSIVEMNTNPIKGELVIMYYNYLMREEKINKILND